MHEPSLREFIALHYPAAANAVLRFGPQYRYGGGHAQARTLDWNPILIALHEAGVVTPGPTIGSASYWYVSWSFARDVNRATETLAPIVGRGWTDAALHYIMRHAYWGPATANGRTRAVRRRAPARTPSASVPLAFRPHDEPAPWLERARTTRAGRPARHVRGLVPDAWRAAPWGVPRDLEERGFQSRQTAEVGEEDEQIAALRQILYWVGQIINSPRLSPESLAGISTMLSGARAAARGVAGYTADLEREIEASLNALDRKRSQPDERDERRGGGERPI
jgi:hypothetical protein